MGGCVSKIQEDLYVRRFAPDRDQHSFTLSRRIERQLKSQEQEDRNMIKLLLLGSGNSGKSTVMKQFKIIHKRGFTTEERKVFRDALWKSAIESMRSLVRSRQDYITASRLGDVDTGMDAGEDGRPRENLIDNSMEPYLQFLLYRVRNEQPLFEEVIIPVAADTGPRAECLSPSKEPGKQLENGGVTSPLMTSMTIVLSSPPVTERKSANLADVMKDTDGQLVLPIPALVDENCEAALDAFEREDDDDSGSGSKVLDLDANDGAKTDDDRLSPIEDGFDAAGPPLVVGDDTLMTSMSGDQTFVDDEDKGDDDSELGAETGADVDEGSASKKKRSYSPTPAITENSNSSDTTPVAPATGTTTSASISASNGQSEKKSKKSKQRQFASAEEELAYLAKQERRQRRKKKREDRQNKRKNRGSQLTGSEIDTNLSGRSGGDGKKKVFSGSSVESFRSDLSKSNPDKKVTAPMVTWEKMTVGRLLQKVWMDPLIQRVYSMEEKSPQLEAPLGYIMNAMDRISEQGFQPTNEDILFARKRTSGVNLLDFEAYGAKFLLIDVGGQRTERKKWLAHFDIVDAVIFVVGLDQYDQVMMEDGVTNRLRDSLELFEEMCASPWFRDSSFLLFLNKSDVFKTKIKNIPLTLCFRGFQGDPHDYDQCSKYIIRKFQQIHSQQANLYRDSQPAHRRGGAGHQAMPHVYPYMTNATDTESMRFVIDTCQDILLRSEMAQWGFFDF
jgi:hypothetical protein